MNWEAVAAIGQVASAVGGIAALLYLALQVKQNTRAVRGTAADAALTHSMEWQRLLIENADLARIWSIGLEDPAALGEDERRRYVTLVTSFLRGADNTHYHFLEGTLDQKLWEPYRATLAAAISRPGMRAVWKLRRGMYTAQFGEFVDTIHAQPPVDSISQANLRLGEVARNEADSAAPALEPAAMNRETVAALGQARD